MLLLGLKLSHPFHRVRDLLRPTWTPPQQSAHLIRSSPGCSKVSALVSSSACEERCANARLHSLRGPCPVRAPLSCEVEALARV